MNIKKISKILEMNQPWEGDESLMNELLDEFEKEQQSLEDYSWEDIEEIKTALWIGYNFGYEKAKNDYR